ncbi:MAG: hypothetical protein U0169_03925 [Polyangiaceae bacterium]
MTPTSRIDSLVARAQERGPSFTEGDLRRLAHGSTARHGVRIARRNRVRATLASAALALVFLVALRGAFAEAGGASATSADPHGFGRLDAFGEGGIHARMEAGSDAGLRAD